MKRDEYVERMKRQIDEWNAKLGEWEVEVQKTQSNVKARFQEQIRALERQRDETLRHLNETREASQAAWMEVSKGTETAWKALQSSFEKAWSEFNRNK